jgi:hypothetical protein
MTPATIEFLFVLAQIAGIFVGFGALISSSAVAGTTETEARTLGVVVYVGIMVVIGSLLPVLLDTFGLEIGWSLKIGSITILAMAWLIIAKSWDGIALTFREKPIYSVIFWTQEFAVQAPLVLILLGVFAAQAEALYLTTIVVSVFEAAQMMVGLVLSSKSLNKT